MHTYAHTYPSARAPMRSIIKVTDVFAAGFAIFTIDSIRPRNSRGPRLLNSWKTPSSCERTLIVPSSCSKQKDLAVPRTPVIRSSPPRVILPRLSRCENARGLRGVGERERARGRGGGVGGERGRDGGEAKERPRLRQITPRDDVTMQLD